MELTLVQVAISAATAIVAAILAAFLTARFALHRFYKEKWWEAKMTSYTSIINALHHMKHDLDISIKATMEGRDTETDYFKNADAKHREAWVEMRRIIDIGDFLLSQEAMTILRKFTDDADLANEPNDSYLEYLETLQSAVEECLPKIKKAGRIDLGLPPLNTGDK